MFCIARLQSEKNPYDELQNYKLQIVSFSLNFIPENLGAVSNERGERFHHDIAEIEKRYQCKSLIAFSTPLHFPSL